MSTLTIEVFLSTLILTLGSGILCQSKIELDLIALKIVIIVVTVLRRVTL